MRCGRHPDREAAYAVAMHYIAQTIEPVWNAVRAEQLLGPLCHECRLELVRWSCSEAPVTPEKEPLKIFRGMYLYQVPGDGPCMVVLCEEPWVNNTKIGCLCAKHTAEVED